MVQTDHPVFLNKMGLGKLVSVGTALVITLLVACPATVKSSSTKTVSYCLDSSGICGSAQKVTITTRAETHEMKDSTEENCQSLRDSMEDPGSWRCRADGSMIGCETCLHPMFYQRLVGSFESKWRLGLESHLFSGSSREAACSERYIHFVFYILITEMFFNIGVYVLSRREVRVPENWRFFGFLIFEVVGLVLLFCTCSPGE
nr:MAG: hypothetical protein [Halyomorpha halys orthomyxo-like virus 1]